MKRTAIVTAVFLCALVGVAVLVIQFVVGLGTVHMGWAGIGAMVGGLLLTAALGMGLMALTFYSDRSGHDRAVDDGPRDDDAEF